MAENGVYKETTHLRDPLIVVEVVLNTRKEGGHTVRQRVMNRWGARRGMWRVDKREERAYRAGREQERARKGGGLSNRERTRRISTGIGIVAIKI